jgi:hypothetical protein
VPQIPVPLIAVLADCLGTNYTHTEIENRFMRVGFEGDPPVGNKVQKCQEWLRRANRTSCDALGTAGALIEEIMEVVPDENSLYTPSLQTSKERIEKQLAALGLAYLPGGHIVAVGSSITAKTLEEMIAARDLIGVQDEFERILSNTDTDPPAAVTAACALLEALFKSYIADQGLDLPGDQSVLPLWKVTRGHLRLNPGDFQDENLKKILSGLASTIDGIAGLRSTAGSAHGRDARSSSGRKNYKLMPRHARIAAHSAMSLAVFFIETIDARKGKG